MNLQIISPEKILFQGDAEMVTAPGTEGEFGVLTGHAPFVSTLKPGVITIEQADKTKLKMAILSGLAEVMPDHCTILIETALDVSNQNAADAQMRLENARKAVDDAITDEQKKQAQQSLALAEAALL